MRLFAGIGHGPLPQRRVRYINKGIGGNRVPDLAARWQDDVLYHRPDRLAVKIGINDRTAICAVPKTASIQPASPLFMSTYWGLPKTNWAVPSYCSPPFYISTDHSGQNIRSRVLELLPRYIEVVERLAEHFDARLVRLHDIFQRQLQYRDADTFCPEPVHPNQAGHLVIAQALMDALTA